MALIPAILRKTGIGWGVDWLGGRGGGGGGGGGSKKSEQQRNIDLMNKGAYSQKFSMNLSDEKLPYSRGGGDDTMPTVGFDQKMMRPTFGTVNLGELND